MPVETVLRLFCPNKDCTLIDFWDKGGAPCPRCGHESDFAERMPRQELIEALKKKENTMHPSVADALQDFEYKHLPPHLAEVSKPICEMAHTYAQTLEGPQLTMGLHKLMEAKDCLVRAAVRKHKREQQATASGV